MIITICDINELRVLRNIAVEPGFSDTGNVIAIRVVPDVVESELSELVLAIEINPAAAYGIADDIVGDQALAEVIRRGINGSSELSVISHEGVIDQLPATDHRYSAAENERVAADDVIGDGRVAGVGHYPAATITDIADDEVAGNDGIAIEAADSAAVPVSVVRTDGSGVCCNDIAGDGRGRAIAINTAAPINSGVERGIYRSVATGNRKTGQNRVRGFTIGKCHHTSSGNGANDRIRDDIGVGRVGAGDGDCLASESNVLGVNAGADEDNVAVRADINCVLDRRIVAGDLVHSRMGDGRQRSNDQSGKKPSRAGV